ncbi:HNH endonuclease signature motif containing protein [Roseovarius sp.]|uniref:HNH endonuclease n=1 Tax=Roseovarius sp. TaxID=1486281 RepID=UPI00257F113E|nr:HNH endonuclease signature motif containing protein [Roseovarius sp.]
MQETLPRALLVSRGQHVMAIRKVCCRPGCDDLSIDGGAHCHWHEQERLDKQAARRARAKLGREAQAGIELYATRAWKDGRRAFLARHVTCCDCGELGLVVEATEVDHIEPHRGDRAKFFDRTNWQALCKPCHSRKTAREVWHGGAIRKS